MIGNLTSGHPFYKLVYPTAGTESRSVINRAANRLVRTVVRSNRTEADLFPELKDSWTAGPTVSTKNALNRPSDCIAIQNVSSAQQATLPDWNTVREFSMGYIDRVKFGVLTKDTTITGYPRLWSLKGKSVLIHPTPDAAHIAYLRYYGIKAEVPLVAPTDTLYMDVDWHGMVCTMAAAILAQRMSWLTQAQAYFQEVQAQIDSTMDVWATEEQPDGVSIENAPSRDVVYGY